MYRVIIILNWCALITILTKIKLGVLFFRVSITQFRTFTYIIVVVISKI